MGLKDFKIIVCFVGIMKSTVMANGVLNRQNPQEYCSTETFSPSCPEQQIIIMDDSLYGRMNVGKCVKLENNLGCSADALSYLDNKCSGRKSCSVQIAEMNVDIQLTCLREMSPYLEAGYKCLDVFIPKSQQCTSPLTIEVSTKIQYLSSMISQKTSCGLHHTPYILEAKQGQRIQLILHDYNTPTSVQSEACINNYGYILDNKNDDVINLCGGAVRTIKIHTSAGNTVQILIDKNMISDKYFVVEFKAIGCANIDPPKYAWIGQANDTVTIGCKSSDEKWTMKCIGNIWLGIMRKCPPPEEKEEIKQVKIAPENKAVDEFGSLPHVSNNHLFAIGIGCVTIIICCTTVVIGVHCVKRYQLPMQKKNPYDTTAMRFNSVYKPVSSATLPLHMFDTMRPPSYPQDEQNAMRSLPEVPNLL